jgi:hypothetical protein
MEENRKFGLFIPKRNKTLLSSKKLLDRGVPLVNTSKSCSPETIDASPKQSEEEQLSALDYDDIIFDQSKPTATSLGNLSRLPPNKRGGSRSSSGLNLRDSESDSPRESKHIKSLLKTASTRQKEREYYREQRLRREATSMTSGDVDTMAETVFVTASYRSKLEQADATDFKTVEEDPKVSSYGVSMMKRNVRIERR